MRLHINSLLGMEYGVHGAVLCWKRRVGWELLHVQLRLPAADEVLISPATAWPLSRMRLEKGQGFVYNLSGRAGT